jgi:uncharacterized protein
MAQQPKVSARHLVGTFALLASLSASPQSFDCQNASTAIELSICQDKDLGVLDLQLAGALGKLSSSQPDTRAALMADERRWLRERDRRCNKPKSGMKDCLVAEYSSRIADLARYAARVAKSRTAVCQLIADRYRLLAHAHPGEAPLNVLEQAPNSGVQLVSASETIDHASTDLVSWAAKQTPPFKLSPELLESLQDYEQFVSGGNLLKALGVPFYSITRSEGSMGCSNSRSFVVHGGVASLSSTPGESNDDDGSCDMGTRYGAVDTTPVAIIQNYDFRPGMTASLDVWTWHGHGFEASCQVALQYKPHFSSKTLNAWGETCTGSDCSELRDAAFELAEAAETDSDALKARSLERLTDPQRAQFELMEQTFEAQRRDPSSDDAFSIPFIQHDRLYVASIGHFTIGWREYADWSVIFASVDDGKLTPRGVFAVGTWKGDLESVSVSEE